MNTVGRAVPGTHEDNNFAEQIALNIEKWASAPEWTSPGQELGEFLERAPKNLIADRFHVQLPFGTGGRRGPVGIGPNGINLHTTALTIVGHTRFLRDHNPGEDLRVIVANDTRVFTDIRNLYSFMDPKWSLANLSSRSIALFACRLYEALGVQAYTNAPTSQTAFMATPELSFSIRMFGAHGGLNISASHNHPDDNGLKVYTASGGQYCPPEDQDLAECVKDAEIPNEITKAFVELSDHPPRQLPANLHEEYIRSYVDRDRELCGDSVPDRMRYPIVYTPMCGTGGDSVGQVLLRSGYVAETPANQGPDGTFASIPMRSPNPEIPGVAAPAIEFANLIQARLVLSSDPDADRLGVEVQDRNDEWHHLTGNQIAALVAFFLIADPQGPKLTGQIVTTVATSRILRAIAESVDREIKDDLLIGFKFVGQFMDSNELNDDPSSNIIFAAEESHGYLTSQMLRDKDAAAAAYIIAHLHVRNEAQGTSLWDYLLAIYDRVGVHVEVGRSLVFLGSEGSKTIGQLMASLRQDPIPTLGLEDISSIDDLIKEEFGPIQSQGEAQSRNLLVFSTEHFRAVVRPSGTEPKLKYYFEYRGEAGEHLTRERFADVQQMVHAASSNFYAELAGRAGYSMSAEALELPDIMPISNKILQTESVTSGKFSSKEQE